MEGFILESKVSITLWQFQKEMTKPQHPWFKFDFRCLLNFSSSVFSPPSSRFPAYEIEIKGALIAVSWPIADR